MRQELENLASQLLSAADEDRLHSLYVPVPGARRQGCPRLHRLPGTSNIIYASTDG